MIYLVSFLAGAALGALGFNVIYLVSFLAGAALGAFLCMITMHLYDRYRGRAEFHDRIYPTAPKRRLPRKKPIVRDDQAAVELEAKGNDGKRTVL